jgi:hypothetical protein
MGLHQLCSCQFRCSPTLFLLLVESAVWLVDKDGGFHAPQVFWALPMRTYPSNGWQAALSNRYQQLHQC